MNLEDRVRELVEEVVPVDRDAAVIATERHLQLTKPAGSLGVLEKLGAQLCAIARRCPPPVPEKPAVVVATGDHGILAKGVSPWPQEITAAMVKNFCEGGAAVNVISEAVGAQVSVLDVGVAGELPYHPRLHRAKIRHGTSDLSEGPAMSREEAAKSILAGAEVAEQLQRRGIDLLVTGDMGIGNTTPAACLVAAFSGLAAEEVTGRGTGIDDVRYKGKIEIVKQALELHSPDPMDPLQVLAVLGGLEHAALIGVMLRGASLRVPVLLDGLASNAAALVARALTPESVSYMVAGHRSTEPGARAALEILGLSPLIDLELRLGEGTGGLLAVPLVQAAARILRDMATFESAGLY